MSDPLVFLNRRFVPLKQAGFSVFDRGLLYGDGLFDTARIYGGKFFRLDAHIDRLFKGLKFLGIKIPYSKAEVEIFTRELALRNQVQEGFARLVVSRGEGILGYSPRGAFIPHVAICARERQVEVRKKEVWKLMVNKHPVSPVPLKSMSYLPHVLAKKAAEDAGCDDAILVDGKGRVIEATGSNLFLWDRGSLITPPLSTGCLPGITRGELFKVAHKEGIRIKEKVFGVKECREADGIILTNSLLELVPCHLGRKPSPSVLSALDELEAAFAYHRTLNLE